MHFIIDTLKVVEVFCAIDDFCLGVRAYFASHPLPEGLVPRHPAGRRPSLSGSEVLTVLALYHLSGFKCFQYYYQRLVSGELRSYFPGPSPPTSWSSPGRRCCTLFCSHYRAGLSARTGHYDIDSRKLPVCNNRRIHSHRIFGDVASRGRGSIGWFYGLKLHLLTEVRRNRLLTLSDKLNLIQRGSIEAVNDILMTVCDIDHTRH